MAPIIEDFSNQRDANGLISNAQDQGVSGNNLLFTGEAILCIQESVAAGWPVQVDGLLRAIYSCRVSTGLFARTPPGQPFRFDQEGQDDYVGLAVASFAGAEPRLAQEILDFGRHSFYTLGPFKFQYYYPTAEKQNSSDIRAWFGRYPALITCLEWAAGEEPNFLRRLAWFVSVAWCGTDQDGWILSHLMAAIGAGRGWFTDLAIKIRMSRFRRSPYAGSIAAVYRAYFNWEHPLARWSD